MNLNTISMILTFLVDLLATLRGDPIHAQQANALTAVHQVTAAVASGAQVDPEPMVKELQALVNLGRAVMPQEWIHLTDVAHRLLRGEASPAPSAPRPGNPVPPAGRVRRVIQPAGLPSVAAPEPFEL